MTTDERQTENMLHCVQKMQLMYLFIIISSCFMEESCHKMMFMISSTKRTQMKKQSINGFRVLRSNGIFFKKNMT